MFYAYIVDDEYINGVGQCQSLNTNYKDIEITETIYEDYKINPDKYIYQNNTIIINPEFESKQIEKRQKQFFNDFFNTSLGYIRRKVSMKTGETKDFLTDLLPVISLGVNAGQIVNIITYQLPDFTKDIEEWESLQEIKQATPLFIGECFNQLSTDFTGV